MADDPHSAFGLWGEQKRSNMTGDEFVAQIEQLRTDNGLDDAQVASALAGMFVRLCQAHQEDPVAFIQWAVDLV
jgi:hypothetical protein